MTSHILLNHSILDLLPDPIEEVQPIVDEDSSIMTKFIGGLHNISAADKIRWRDDVRTPLMLLEREGNRGEFYPYKGKAKGGYVTQYVSFLNHFPMLVITSHSKYHIAKNPIASVAYVSDINRHATQQPVMVWHKNGRLHTPDFMKVTSDTMNYSVHAEMFSRHYPDHDYLTQINIHNLSEVWEDNEYVKTRYDGFQVILKGKRTPEEGDPSTEDWLRKHCKGGFDLLADEPFLDEQDEFNFLTDMAISM